MLSRHPVIAEAVTKRLCSGASGSDAKPTTQQKEQEVKTVTITINVLRSGTTGDQVRTVQRLLRQLGCTGQDGKALSIDGQFGANTMAAVKKFQKKNTLSTDGVVGAKTWEKLLGGVAR